MIVIIMGRIKPSIEQHLRRVRYFRNVTLVHIFIVAPCIL